MLSLCLDGGVRMSLTDKTIVRGEEIVLLRRGGQGLGHDDRRVLLECAVKSVRTGSAGELPAEAKAAALDPVAAQQMRGLADMMVVEVVKGTVWYVGGLLTMRQCAISGSSNGAGGLESIVEPVSFQLDFKTFDPTKEEGLALESSKIRVLFETIPKWVHSAGVWERQMAPLNINLSSGVINRLLRSMRAVARLVLAGL